MQNPGAVTHSSVGGVVDVATPSTRKLRALGFMWASISLFPFAVINYLIINSLTSDHPMLSINHPVHLLGAALMPFMGWFSLGSAVQRFHAASEKRYFRCGPGGISVSLPRHTSRETFLFSFRTLRFDLRWDGIKTWYPYVHSMNGIPVERSIVFETLNGEKVCIRTYHFAETPKQIAERINRARILPTEVTAQARETNVNQQSEDDLSTLPAGIGERSVQIKKKRDSIKQIDLRAVAVSDRMAHLKRVADMLEARLNSLCPIADGYKCSRKHYRPFREWKDMFGVRLFVRRGLLSGYEIQVEPDDSECRKLTISMCRSTVMADIRKHVSIAVGIVFVLLSIKWLSLIEYWLGDFARFTPIVLVLIFLAALAVSTGLLQIPIGLLSLLVSDKQSEEVQKEGIRMSIREMAI
jgi:hypothetical protein